MELAAAGVTPDFARLLLEFDDPEVKNLLVELDEQARLKPAVEFDVRLQDVLASFQHRARCRRNANPHRTPEATTALRRRSVGAVAQDPAAGKKPARHFRAHGWVGCPRPVDRRACDEHEALDLRADHTQVSLDAAASWRPGGNRQVDHCDLDLQELVATGKAQGYLTYDQVNDYLPDEAVTPEKLDNLLIALEELGIELVTDAARARTAAATAEPDGRRATAGPAPSRARAEPTADDGHAPPSSCRSASCPS